jgi:hypothetical protein
MTSVGSALKLFAQRPEEARISSLFGSTGELTELAASVIAEQQASTVPLVGRPFKRGLSGFLWRSAALLTASSLALGLPE